MESRDMSEGKEEGERESPRGNPFGRHGGSKRQAIRHSEVTQLSNFTKRLLFLETMDKEQKAAITEEDISRWSVPNYVSSEAILHLDGNKIPSGFNYQDVIYKLKRISESTKNLIPYYDDCDIFDLKKIYKRNSEPSRSESDSLNALYMKGVFMPAEGEFGLDSMERFSRTNLMTEEVISLRSSSRYDYRSSGYFTLGAALSSLKHATMRFNGIEWDSVRLYAKIKFQDYEKMICGEYIAGAEGD